MLNGMVKDNINYITIVGLPESNIYQDMVNLYSEIFEDADLIFFKQRIKKLFRGFFFKYMCFLKY